MYIDLITIDLCPGQGGGGVRPSGTLDISENGVYDVYSYASASVSVPFYTETLEASINNVYYPGSGINGFSEVIVNVPQSVTGFTEKEITEGIQISNLSNSASYVHPYAFKNNTYLRTVYLPNCTSIGENAFELCNNLSSIYLPNVETIGKSAFENCDNLSSIYLPNAKKVGGFRNCFNLQEVVLPNAEVILYNGFSSCKKLSSVSIPNCISIESYAFLACYSLTYVDLPKVKYLFQNAFQSCLRLTGVSVPLLQEIGGNSTFQYCNSLSSLYLPKLRAVRAFSVFNDCRNLSILDIPAVVTNGSKLVERNPNLKELYINSETYVTPTYMLSTTTTGITSIYTNINNVSRFMVASGWSSYSDKIIGVGDSSVLMLSYSDGVVNGMTKGIESTYYTYLGMSVSDARTNVVSVDLPNCDYIDSFTFQGHSNLTSISLPNCEYIGSYGFANVGLTSISLPNCEYIGSYAFNSCSALTNVNLQNCKHIYYDAFNGCGNLPSLDLPICEQIDGYAFEDAGLITLTLGSNKVVSASLTALYKLIKLSSIYVPASLLDSYKSATGFSQFSNKIFPIE